MIDERTEAAIAKICEELLALGAALEPADLMCVCQVAYEAGRVEGLTEGMRTMRHILTP